MKLKPYPKYKSSGTEWIADIPEHWDIKQLKFVAKIQPSNVDKKSKEGEQSVRLCNYVDVYKNELIHPDLNLMKATAPKSQIKKFLLEPGDVIVTKDSESWDDIAVPAFVESSADDIICGYHLAQIKPSKDVSGKFLFRCFCAEGIKSQFETASVGVTRYALSKRGLDSAFFPIPRKNEQTRIVEFLDRETGRIDELVAEKETMLGLLEEKRQAIITDAVTGRLQSEIGLPNSGTIPSGIDWLGDIPNHWKVYPLKRISSKTGSGKTPRGGANVYQDEGIYFLRSMNIRFEGLKLDDVVYISKEIHKSMRSSQVQPEDVLLNITGASIGRVTLVPKDFPEANVSQHVCIIRPRREAVEPGYLALVMASNFVQLQIKSYESGSSREGLNFQQAGSLLLPIPESLEEQEGIVDYVNTKMEKLDNLRSEIKSAIDLLKEHRTALVTAAVTGQIDVRAV